MNMRLLAGGATIALALGAAMVGSPDPRGGTSASLRSLAEIEHEADHLSALELAQWIRQRRQGLRVLDVRSDSEYAMHHIPTAERVSLSDIAAKRLPDDATIVLYSDGGSDAAQGWAQLRTSGVRNVYVLRGGYLAWMDDVMNPVPPSEITRYFGGVPRQEIIPIPARATRAVARLRSRGC